jgi:hypothetical protein
MGSDESKDGSDAITGLRFMLGMVGLGLLGVGIYLAWDVFAAVHAAATDPQKLEPAHKTFMNLIQAERMVIRAEPNMPEFAPGPTIALAALWGWYLLWALIPMWMMAAGARIVVASLRRS